MSSTSMLRHFAQCKNCFSVHPFWAECKESTLIYLNCSRCTAIFPSLDSRRQDCDKCKKKIGEAKEPESTLDPEHPIYALIRKMSS